MFVNSRQKPTIMILDFQWIFIIYTYKESRQLCHASKCIKLKYIKEDSRCMLGYVQTVKICRWSKLRLPISWGLGLIYYNEACQVWNRCATMIQLKDIRSCEMLRWRWKGKLKKFSRRALPLAEWHLINFKLVILGFGMNLYGTMITGLATPSLRRILRCYRDSIGEAKF